MVVVKAIQRKVAIYRSKDLKTVIAYDAAADEVYVDRLAPAPWASAARSRASIARR